MSSTIFTRPLTTWNESKPKKVAFKMNSSTTMEAFSITGTNVMLASKKAIKPAIKSKSKVENMITIPKIDLKGDKGCNSEKRRPNAFSERYRFLNDGIVAQCRKWERLQERALALDEHKKLLSELRWKMVLNGNFNNKKFYTNVKENIS